MSYPPFSVFAVSSNNHFEKSGSLPKEQEMWRHSSVLLRAVSLGSNPGSITEDTTV